MMTPRSRLSFGSLILIWLLFARGAEPVESDNSHDEEILRAVLTFIAADSTRISVLGEIPFSTRYIVVDENSEKLTEWRTVEDLAGDLCTAAGMDTCELGRLVAELSRKNQKTALIPVASDTSRGFVIDTDHHYSGYFGDTARGGWEAWYEENPRADGSCVVSLPAYDVETGMVVVYYGIQVHWLAWVIWRHSDTPTGG